MKRIILGVVLVLIGLWCFTAPVSAVMKKTLSPVHEKRLEEQDRHKETYGAIKVKPTEAEKKEDAEKKNAEGDSSKISSADTMDIPSEEKVPTEKTAPKGKKNQGSPKPKKSIEPKVIEIEPTK